MFYYKNNVSLWSSGRYFFMEITKSNRIIIKQIMYSLSIAITSFLGDDGITAQLLHCFKSYLYRITPTSTLYNIYLYISSKIAKNADNTKNRQVIFGLVCFLFLILFQITIHSYPTCVKFFTVLFLPNIDQIVVNLNAAVMDIFTVIIINHNR